MIDEAFTWGDDRPPNTPSHKTLIYEMHVKGFTKLNDEVPEELRGTYAGLSARSRRFATCASSASPRSNCCPFTCTPTIASCSTRGLVNYWGYNTLCVLRPRAALRVRRRTRPR